MAAIPIIVHLTIREARRRRVLAAALIGGGAFLAVFSAGIAFATREMVKAGESFVEQQAVLTVLTVAGLYATNMLAVLLAVLLPVDALSGEIDSGIMQTVASKPIRRAEIVLGKWIGYVILVSAYVVLLYGGVLLAGRIAAGHVPVSAAGGIGLMLLETALLLTVSIAGGTRLSTVANGIVGLGFYGMAFVGGWVEQIGGFVGLHSARTLGIAVSLISPPDALWRMAVYHMQPAIVRGTIDFPLVAAASVPNTNMLWWALGFMAVVLGWAVRSFERRPL